MGCNNLVVVAEIPHLWVMREEVAGTRVRGPAALLLSMLQARRDVSHPLPEGRGFCPCL
jgi:hypothetical protein